MVKHPADMAWFVFSTMAGSVNSAPWLSFGTIMQGILSTWSRNNTSIMFPTLGYPWLSSLKLAEIDRLTPHKNHEGSPLLFAVQTPDLPTASVIIVRLYPGRWRLDASGGYTDQEKSVHWLTWGLIMIIHVCLMSWNALLFHQWNLESLHQWHFVGNPWGGHSLLAA